MFSDPTQGDQCKPAEILGHLLIVRPTELRVGVPTANYGPKDAMQVDVADLDDNGKVYRESLWFNGVLIGSLRSHIGELVLARMTQGQAKPGQNPPYVLQAVADGADKQRAQQWVNANPDFNSSFASPAASNPAPAVVPQQTAPVASAQTMQITPETAALLAQLQAKQAG
jgi:hypothetical protein